MTALEAEISGKPGGPLPVGRSSDEEMGRTIDETE
jgi:hypothetical protein